MREASFLAVTGHQPGSQGWDRLEQERNQARAGARYSRWVHRALSKLISRTLGLTTQAGQAHSSSSAAGCYLALHLLVNAGRSAPTGYDRNWPVALAWARAVGT